MKSPSDHRSRGFLVHHLPVHWHCTCHIHIGNALGMLWHLWLFRHPISCLPMLPAPTKSDITAITHRSLGAFVGHSEQSPTYFFKAKKVGGHSECPFASFDLRKKQKAWPHETTQSNQIDRISCLLCSISEWSPRLKGVLHWTSGQLCLLTGYRTKPANQGSFPPGLPKILKCRHYIAWLWPDEEGFPTCLIYSYWIWVVLMHSGAFLVHRVGAGSVPLCSPSKTRLASGKYFFQIVEIMSN